MAVNQLYIPTMADMHQVNVVTETVRQIKGVWRVQANPANRSVRIEHENSVRVSTFITALHRAGYADVSVLV
jgi:copper chaperone CopZ